MNKEMSYIYKPNCKDCSKLTDEYYFTCKSCGAAYSACVKEISGKNEKLIYCHFPGVPNVHDMWGQKFWKREFDGNLIRMEN